jgi:hypothetical protein
VPDYKSLCIKLIQDMHDSIIIDYPRYKVISAIIIQ